MTFDVCVDADGDLTPLFFSLHGLTFPPLIYCVSVFHPPLFGWGGRHVACGWSG